MKNVFKIVLPFLILGGCGIFLTFVILKSPRIVHSPSKYIFKQTASFKNGFVQIFETNSSDFLAIQYHADDNKKADINHRTWIFYFQIGKTPKLNLEGIDEMQLPGADNMSLLQKKAIAYSVPNVEPVIFKSFPDRLKNND
jgi:hypothetical protein